MNIIDSSAWLEYFANSINAKNFEKAIEDTKKLIVPSIVLYEVFKKLLKETDEHNALEIIAHLKQGKVVNLDIDLSLEAARLSHLHNLAMADSIILAIAQKHKATIWTQDSDFRNLPYVKYFPKK
ncbi:type II toxin-antitoxin system VapC family toxin [Patescibacteria group bacterium]|nr:type II toxin-antitoxin system VapC family toxin [Patescibacteria group bacterium]